MFSIILWSIIGFIIFVALFTVLVDCDRDSTSEKYWYFLRLWFCLAIIPEVLIWYFSYHEGLNLYHSLNPIIKVAPFIAALISTWLKI